MGNTFNFDFWVLHFEILDIKNKFVDSIFIVKFVKSFKNKEMAKVSISASVEKDISDRIQQMADIQDRSFSYVAEKVLEKGLEVVDKEKQNK